MTKKLNMYCDLLLEWNEKFNLTAITDREEIFLKHFADSLLGDDFIKGTKILDVGSGAGLPGIPLALIKPNCQFTLIDSLNKRVNFVKEVILKLELANVTAEHMRAEDFKEREGFDTVISRAVAPLNVLVEYCLPFVKIGGVMMAYKGRSVDEEVSEAKRAVKIMGGGEIDIQRRMLDKETERTFVIIQKVGHTPPEFPRGGNKPRSQAL